MMMTRLLIKNGLCIDGKSSEPKTNWIVVIDAEKIVYFGEEASFLLSGDETVINANGGTILPGFIDNMYI
jgi:predicted amidohydrolase YtcJ